MCWHLQCWLEQRGLGENQDGHQTPCQRSTSLPPHTLHKKTPVSLKSVPSAAVKRTDFIKSGPLGTHLFNILRDALLPRPSVRRCLGSSPGTTTVLPAEGQLDTFFTGTRSSPEGTRAPGGQLSPRGNSLRGHVTSAKIPASEQRSERKGCLRGHKADKLPPERLRCRGGAGRTARARFCGCGARCQHRRQAGLGAARPTCPAPRVTEAREEPPGARRTADAHGSGSAGQLSPHCGQPARPGAPVGVSPATRHVSKRSLSFPNTYPCGAGSPAYIAHPAAAGRGSRSWQLVVAAHCLPSSQRSEGM